MIYERVKFVRDFIRLNQTEFGEKISISRSQVAAIENNLRTLTDRVITDICREFNVNEEWLRNGIGEPFVEPNYFSLDEYAKQNKLSALEFELIKAYIALDPKIRQPLIDSFKAVFLSNGESGGNLEFAEELSPPAGEYRAEWNNNLTEEEAVNLVRQRYADAKRGLA